MFYHILNFAPFHCIVVSVRQHSRLNMHSCIIIIKFRSVSSFCPTSLYDTSKSLYLGDCFIIRRLEWYYVLLGWIYQHINRWHEFIKIAFHLPSFRLHRTIPISISVPCRRTAVHKKRETDRYKKNRSTSTIVISITSISSIQKL